MKGLHQFMTTWTGAFHVMVELIPASPEHEIPHSRQARHFKKHETVAVILGTWV
jgi:hypothetical protein